MNVYLMKEGASLPKEKNCLLVTRSGFSIKKDMPWIEAIVPVPRTNLFDEVSPYCRLKVSSIPASVFLRTCRFFQHVYRLKKAESVVLLHWSAKKKSYKITVPEQQVNHDTVRYRMDERVEGYTLLGTIHSHASMSAFHSAEDVSNNQGFDGIHITVGNLDQEHLSVFGEVFVNGHTFPLPKGMICGLKRMITPIFKRPKGEIPEGLRNTLSVQGTRYELPASSRKKTPVPTEWLERVKSIKNTSTPSKPKNEKDHTCRTRRHR